MPDMKIQNPKSKIQGLLLALILVSGLAPRALSLTSFTFQFYNSDGSPDTNVSTLSPVGGNQISVYGNNLVIAKTISLTPNSSGAGTGSAEPNAYKLSIPTSNGIPMTAYANIPDTTNIFPLGAYLSNAPAIYTPSSTYNFLTNQLNGALGLIQALQFQPMTNSPGGVTNVLGYAVIPPTPAAFTNALGYVPLASSYAALTNLVGGAPVLANNPQFVLALTNASAFYSTNLPLLRGFTALNGVTNAFVTNADGSFTPVVGWTNQTAPQFTGIVGYTNSSGTASRLFVTNGIIVNNTTP